MKKLILILVFIPTLAFAQQTPLEQSLGNRLFKELNTSVTCDVQNINLQKQLQEAQDKIKKLEDELKSK